MDKDRLRSFLKHVGVKSSVIRSQGWIGSRCPLAPWRHDGGVDKNPSFGLRIMDGGESYGNCFSCSWKGDLLSLVTRIKGIALPDELEALDLETALSMVMDEEKAPPIDFAALGSFDDQFETPPDAKVRPFKEPWLASFKKANDNAYLKKRGVSSWLSEFTDLRYDTGENRICFPIRTFDGVLAGMHGRDVTNMSGLRYKAYKDGKKYNPMVWLGENHVSLDSPLVITEGPFDYIRIMEVYSNVLCALSVGMSNDKLIRIRNAGSILTMFDVGMGGDTARSTLSGRYGARVKHWVPEEFGDVGATPLDKLSKVLSDYYFIG